MAEEDPGQSLVTTSDGIPSVADFGAPSVGSPSPVGWPTAVSIGIMAYNEEANIAHAIRTLLQQQVESAHLEELIVVASGCTDATAAIVSEIAAADPRVRLLLQPERLGKASAINLFIAAARAPLLLMSGADMLVKEGSVEAMLRTFADPAVGMVGGHPIPVNDESHFLGYTVHLLWRIHDRLAREAPKLGEIVAFRNVVPSIPLDTAVDEISLQALVTQLGYRVVYQPLAIAYNRGPTTVRDFLRQRRRIYAGHLQVRQRQGYSASTMSVRRIWRALRGSGSFGSPRLALWTGGAIVLEAVARALGHLDVAWGRQYAVWRPVITTKDHIADGADGQGPTCVLVFHIVNYHHHQLEIGMRTFRLLTQDLVKVVRETLGSQAAVSAQKSGTIIALLFAEREEAERAASRVVAKVEGVPLADGAKSAALHLACGIVAFPLAGQDVAAPYHEAAPETRISVLGVPVNHFAQAQLRPPHPEAAGWE